MITQEPVSSHLGSSGAARARDTIHQFAGKAHGAIDKLEQTLGEKTGKASQSLGQGRHYGDQVRERIDAQPLQAAGVAFAAGVVASNLFTPSRSKTREEPVHERRSAMRESARAAEARAQRWMQAAGGRLQQLADSSQYAVKKLGATTAMGVAGAREMSADMLDRTRRAIPPARVARAKTQALMARSQAYGTVARSQMQQHPMAGVALALGVGALATQMVMNRRSTEDDPYAPRRATYAVGKDGEVLGPEWGEPRTSLMAARPMVSAGLALGVGVLLGALLARR